MTKATRMLRMSSGRLTFIFAICFSWLVSLAAAAAAKQSEEQPAATAKTQPEMSANKRAALEAQRGAEADPSEANLFAYASSLLKLDYSSAEKIYRFAIGKFPNSVRLHAGLASALWGEGKADEGAAELCRAAEIDPADPHPLEFLVAMEHIPAPLSDKVAEGLRKLMRIYPNDGLILFDYEMVISHRYDDATSAPEDFEPALKQAIRLTPQLPQAYYQLSLFYGMKQEFDRELDAMHRAVELSPQDENLRYKLAMLYKKHGDKEAFQRELAIFLKMHNSPPHAAP